MPSAATAHSRFTSSRRSANNHRRNRISSFLRPINVSQVSQVSLRHCPPSAAAVKLFHFSSRNSHHHISRSNRNSNFPVLPAFAEVGGGDDGVKDGNGSGGGDDGESGSGGEGHDYRKEALLVLAEVGRSLESMPKDLAAAIDSGRIPASIVKKFLELEESPFLKWLLQFGGFKERLLADDLFLAKVGIECGVGMFTKTAAEYEKRKENFSKELEIVFADVVMAVIADFMLVYLPAPTVSLRPPISVNANSIARFFYNCPDNAFQTTLGGVSYSLLQRLGAIVRNGTKLFAVGTASSLVGTVVTNTLINAKKAVQKSSEGELENIPVLATSIGYGVYMSISSNLRYQILAGVIEQRLLEPVLHQHKLILSAICFAVRTGNTYLGSLLWVDYARLVGLQKAPETESV